MRVEMTEIQKITPYLRNPRKNARAVALVKESIRRYGWRQPIVTDRQGVIVAGHTRYLAALALEQDHVPVHVAEELSDAQIRAYRLADNKLHEASDWDFDALALELTPLKGMGDCFTGFAADEIDALLADKPVLPEKEELLHPIKYTRMLISVPVGTSLERMDEVVEEVIRAGGQVDYAGN